MQTQAEYLALIVKGDFDIGDLGAAMRGGDEVFDACACPFERHVEALRQFGDRDFFRI